MQRSWVLGFCTLLLLAAVATGPAGARAVNQPDEVDLLLLVAAPYGGNYNLMRDAMELRGWNITVAAVTSQVPPCHWGGPIIPDLLVGEIADVTAYDCLLIMPARAYTGASHYQLLSSPKAMALVAGAGEAGLLVGAVCGGTRVLAAADLIDGLQVTGHPLYADEYIAAGATYIEETPPLLDGRILTTRRSQYYAEQICDVVAGALDSLWAAGGDR